MPAPVDHLAPVSEVVEALRRLGLDPILIGGMALVVLGSRRVTRDFDFVIPHPGERLADVISLFYDQGLELASRLDEAGDVKATIANRNVAAIRLRLDAPASAYFFNPTTGLRIDLLFDFPIPAAKLDERAARIKIRSHVFRIASVEDLLKLKKIARRHRSVPGDADDIAFLQARRERG
jgi:predicted nucleotidyltransferase